MTISNITKNLGLTLTTFHIENKVVKTLQKLVDSELKAYPKHQRERWSNISQQTTKFQMISRVSRCIATICVLGG